MKVFVVYGSDSDAHSYGPLIESLKEKHEVSFEVISAHRKPDELFARLKKDDFDIVIAGAGIAAALPGVCAAKTKRPVFGVPVAAHFDGLDSLGSILQMPFQVPVLTCGAKMESEIVKFLNFSDWKNEPSREINIVVRNEVKDTPWAQKEIARTEKFATDLGLNVEVTGNTDSAKMNVVLVDKEEDIRADEFCIHVPLLKDEDKKDPTKFLMVHDWTKKGGLWVCTNNARNAVISFQKIFNIA